MPNARKIGLFIDLVHSQGKAIVEGMLDYCREHAPQWELLTEMWGDIGAIEASLSCQLDGLICQDPGLARRTTKPAVVLTSDPHLPSVFTDPAAVARLAVEHLRQLGLTRFAFLGESRNPFSDEVEHCFLRLLGQAVSVHRTPQQWSDRRAQQEDALQQWLGNLGRPVGLFAASDLLARRALTCAREMNIKVPRDLAVLGMGDSELAHRLTNPPLSCIIQVPHQVGWQAAQMLHGLLSGGHPDSRRVAPSGVLARASTGETSISDPVVNRSRAFIRENLQQGLQVEDVAREVCVSRRWLEQLYQKFLGHTPASEIRRVQLDTATRLLLETDWPLRVIARECGLASPERLNVFFKRETGISPGRFRTQQVRGGAVLESALS